MAGSIYDITRAAVIDDIAAETDGNALTAGAQAGYLFDLGGVRLGPVIGLRYAKVELDGFTETGDPVLTLNVEEQETDSLLGTAGIELRADLDIGGTRSPALSAGRVSSRNSPATAAPSATRSPRRPRSSTNGCCPTAPTICTGGSPAASISASATRSACR